MAKQASSSFRRILLARLLLLSVPVLLIGMYVTFTVTYRKARSALLDTARRNLTESAIVKSESISQSIAALSSNMVTASESSVFADQTPEQSQRFIEQLSQQLPTKIQCVQLLDATTQAVVNRTCEEEFSAIPQPNSWPERQEGLLDRSQVNVQVILPDRTQPQTSTEETNSVKGISKLELLFAAPVYDDRNTLSYILVVQSSLVQRNRSKPGSLSGSSVIISEDGTILMHPSRDRVGRNISQERDVDRLQSLVKNAFAGRQDFLHFSFSPGEELVAGYTAIPSPIDRDSEQQWAILAVTRLDDALADLGEIQRLLLTLLLGVTSALIVASVLATLYISRDLARPLEKLRDYALHKDNLHSNDQIPQNLKIREFNELARALNSMVKRLKAWAQELEVAWKEAQTANQLKSEFLTTISHELRTPLNGIIGSIRLIEDGFCDDREEEMEFLQQADGAAVHLLGIIDDILDISKIESGQLAVTLEPVPLNPLLKEVVELKTPEIQAKGLELLPLKLEEDCTVYADPEKLKQVFYNIIDNAIKFTKEGSIAIKTYVEASGLPGKIKLEKIAKEEAAQKSDQLPALDSGQQVAIQIEDTGIGIDSEQMHKLFQPFVMVDGSTTREAGGAGLGLAIARNLIELMGGTIVLTSPGKNQGTKVKIILPLMKTVSN